MRGRERKERERDRGIPRGCFFGAWGWLREAAAVVGMHQGAPGPLNPPSPFIHTNTHTLLTVTLTDHPGWWTG